ncbi:MAG: TetR/AcrR family transcriptional regulator [Actinomycetes bacterium]
MNAAVSSASPAAAGRLPKHERRAQVLVAAQEVFVGVGYHSASMDDIAERAGVSKPILYQHFPSKLDLYLALLDQSSDQLLAAVEQALESTNDNKARVTATIQAYFDFVDHAGGGFRLLFENDLSNEPAVRQRLDSVNGKCAALIAQVIASDTGLSDDESLLLAAALTGLAQTTARHWLRENGSVPMQTATRIVAGLSWRGISGFPLTLT